jgi:Holliday junction DNA helicase RuvA
VIAHLRGRLISKHPGQIVVETGGVGYELAISIPTFSALPDAGAEVSLHVYTHVREDALALFGFLRADEKRLFERLLAVSGIGPKLAITILSGMETPNLIGAIRGNDIAQLTRVPGIGRKTAERMVLELRDKLESFAATPAATPAGAMEEDVISALVNLGYQRGIAEKAVAAAQNGSKGAEKNFDVLFRNALAAVGGR